MTKLRKKKSGVATTAIMVIDSADALIGQIRIKKAQYDQLSNQMAEAYERFKREYEDRLTPVKNDLMQLESALTGLMKREKTLIFNLESKSDRVDLPSGAALLRAVIRRIVRKRDALSRLKSAGRTDAVKIVESVDWGALESWPDADLAAAGLPVKMDEKYDYAM